MRRTGVVLLAGASLAALPSPVDIRYEFCVNTAAVRKTNTVAARNKSLERSKNSAR